jgi:hypothetical protein
MSSMKRIAVFGPRAMIAGWALSRYPPDQLNIECVAVPIIQRPSDLTPPGS